MWEAIQKGDAAYLAQDYQDAIAHYREAIKHQRESAVAYQRLGEALRAVGNSQQAIEILATGLRFADTVAMRGKVVFVQADTHEREKQYPAARTKWEEYQKLSTGAKQGESKGSVLYPESAEERLKQVNAVEERNKAYALVKERIQKREAELEPKGTTKK